MISGKHSTVPPASDPADIFDRAAISKRLMNDPGLVREVLEGFLTDTPSRMLEIRGAVDREDPEGVRRHAHALKGAVLNINANALQTAITQLEDAAEVGDTAQVREKMQRLEEHYRILCGILETETGGGGSQ